MEFAESFEVLLPLALILCLSRLMGMGAKKISMPSVIGMLLAGILLGLLKYIPWEPLHDAFFGESISFALGVIGKIGVVLIMFSVGLGTDLKKLKQTGVASVVITTMGVVVPMLLGFLVAFLFDYYTPVSLTGGEGAAGEFNLLSDLFYGAILTATSVSVTVAVLKEMNKLDTKMGTSIVAAAVIDDVIGIVILSVLTGFSSSGTGDSFGWKWFSPNAGMVIIKIILFFVVAIGLGVLLRRLFNWIERKLPHARRVPLFAISVCFLYAYGAEKLFGVADITGAYLAGIVLGGTLSETPYVEYNVDKMGYFLFSPVFFANIGMNLDFGGITPAFLAFGAVYVVAALVGKLVGCGLGAKICRFSGKDSYRIGLGMMARAEVILICCDKGQKCGLVSSAAVPFVFAIILITSILTPLLLKLSYGKNKKTPPEGGTGGENGENHSVAEQLSQATVNATDPNPNTVSR